MDKFVVVTKPAVARERGKEPKQTKQSLRFNPYAVPEKQDKRSAAWREKKRVEKILAPLQPQPQSAGSDSAVSSTASSSTTRSLTKHILDTLSDPSNPITHSTTGAKADHVSSCFTGHQRGEGGSGRSLYNKERYKKLDDQLESHAKEEKGIFFGTRIHVNGYTDGTTELEVKRLVAIHGGSVARTASGATHILASHGLNGSKTHKYLGKAKNTTHIVKPEWLLESIKAGKRLKEYNYSIVSSEVQGDLRSMFKPT